MTGATSAAAHAGERLAEILVDLGAPPVFGVPGGQTLPLYQATRARGMRHVVMRDERSAACAADAYARVTGGVGVCDATVGPGVTNLVSGLAESLAASIPVLAVVADIRTDQQHLRQGAVASQAMDQGALLAAVTKWVGRVERAEALDDVTGQALRVATSGRPGPVVVEIPEDVWLEATPRTRRFEPADARPLRSRPAPDPEAVEAAAALLAAAARPVILAGGGAVASGASGHLRAFAAEHGIPVVTSINGKGVVDEHDPLALGVVGLFGTAPAAAALHRADVVLVVGCKLDQVTTHGWRLPREDARVVHVDVDGVEHGRARRPDVAMVADARQGLAALRSRMAGTVRPSRPWTAGGDGARPPRQDRDGMMHPAAAVQAVDAALRPDDVVVCDASFSSGWAAAHLHVAHPRRFVAPRGLAGVGWSGGASIGAALASGAGRVVVVAGDGGWAYGMAELETAARLDLDVTYVVLNNSGLGWILLGEDHMGITPRSTFTDVDFATVARGLGVAAERVTTSAELSAWLEEAGGASGPRLVDVVVDIAPSPVVSLTEALAGPERSDPATSDPATKEVT